MTGATTDSPMAFRRTNPNDPANWGARRQRFGIAHSRGVYYFMFDSRWEASPTAFEKGAL